MEGQLRKFRKGIHPKTGTVLLLAVELEPDVPPTRNNEEEEEEEHKLPDGFYEYVPAALPKAVPADSGQGQSTSDRQKALLERVRAKERTSTATMDTAGSTATAVRTSEPCATVPQAIVTNDTGSSTVMVAHCPTRCVTLDTAGSTAEWCNTNGGNYDSVNYMGRSGVVPWEPCVTSGPNSTHALSGTDSDLTLVPPVPSPKCHCAD